MASKKCPIAFEEADDPHEHLLHSLPQTKAASLDPLARAVGQEISLVEARRFLKRCPIIGGAREARGKRSVPAAVR